MTVAHFNRTTIAHDSSGDGDPLVLIHGSWGDRQTWGFVIADLAESFRVISYDRRGHGESAAETDAGTVHDDVEDVAALIKVLDIAPAHIVASSYGGCVALRLGSSHPELVAGMVCHEPPLLGALEGVPDGAAIAELEWRKLGQVRELLDRARYREGAEYFVEHVALGPGTWDQLPAAEHDKFVRYAPTFLGELRDPDALRVDLGSLEELDRPVLLSQGDQSPPWFARVIELLAGSLPNGQRHVIPGAGHVPHLTHPDAYVTVVRDFLLSCSATP